MIHSDAIRKLRERAVLTPLQNFQSWYSSIIRSLYGERNTGFVLLLITFPLLERYTRQKLGLENDALSDAFFDELVNLIPELGNGDHARNFWRTYRNGLLHAVTLNTETRSGMTLPPSSVSQDKPSCFSIDPSGSYWVNPELFAKRVLSIIESDFNTFEIGLLPGITFPQVYDNSLWIMTGTAPGPMTWTALPTTSYPP
jgi:hypothetical protein